MTKQFFLERTTKLSDLDLSENERQLLSKLLKETKLKMPFMVNIEIAYGNIVFPKIQFIGIDEKSAPNEAETYLYPIIGQNEVLEYLLVTHHQKEGGKFLYNGNFVKYNQPYITCFKKTTFKAEIEGVKTFDKAREIEAYIATLERAKNKNENGLSLCREILNIFGVSLNRVIELQLLDLLMIRGGEITFLRCEKEGYTLQYNPFYILYETEEVTIRQSMSGKPEITLKNGYSEDILNNQEILEKAIKRIGWFKKKVEKLQNGN